MIGRTVGLVLAAGVVFVSASSCTNDFGAFEGTAQPAGKSGSSSSGGDVGADSGPDGSSPGGTGGGSGASGSGGAGGVAGSGGSRGGSGGKAPDGGDAGGAPATGGGGATGGAAGDSGTGTGGSAGNCSSSQKRCGGNCVGLDDPATGCSGTSCSACSYPNAASICSVGQCAQGTCNSGFGDCDTSAAAPGCERPVHDDLANCGGCNRTCSSTRVTTLQCTANTCTSFCEPGFGNCSKPTAGVDNGCETNVTANTTNCGGCGNNCGMQRNKSCVAGKCVCDSARDCYSSNNPPASVLCDASGVCSCTGVLCVTGEGCTTGGGECSCNGGAKCGAGQTCCQTPAGCFDLQTDRDNCGGCNHACSPGFICVNAVCMCDAASDCDAGTSGVTSCSSGVCSCGSATCLPGQRCLAGGVCG